MISQIPNKNVIPVYNNAGFHNSIYRGKYLGDHVTDAQWLAIQNGTFEDLFVGDYWTINGVNWRIAGFNYWINTGDTNCTTPHVVIVPDTNLVNAKMNSSNITTGAYAGSDFYTGNNDNTGKATAITAVNNAFGSGHILTHREPFANAATDGKSTQFAWYDSTVDLMNEIMVYGTSVWGPSGYEAGIDKLQLPLFRLAPEKIFNGGRWWLRNVGTQTGFAIVSANGSAQTAAANASYTVGVRPAFAICHDGVDSPPMS